MANQPSTQPAPASPQSAPAALFEAAGGAADVPSARVLQSLVDEAANINVFSLSEKISPIFKSASHGPVGINIHQALHRFQIHTTPPSRCSPLTGRHIVGEKTGRWSDRWLFIPDDFVAAPDREPPPTRMDHSRAQRFVMLDSVCRFGDGDDGFRGFGTGRTFLGERNSPGRLFVTAIGTILDGFGRFAGHEDGTYVVCGTLDLERGFIGNVMLRVMDRQQTFWTDSVLPDAEQMARPEPDVSYLLFRGEAVPSDAVTPRLGPGGQFLGLTVEQGLRKLNIDFNVRRGALESTMDLGPAIGKIVSTINFNPASPGGDSTRPIPFTNFDEFTFTDQLGNWAGSFTANSSEGRVFLTQVGGRPAIRFGGTGKILEGQGPFKGINGLMTDNSVVVFSPHVSASIYLLRVTDPSGIFRSAFGV